MISALKPYEEYRPAEGGWLGEIPTHWAIRRMKYVVQETDSRSTSGKEQLLRISQFTGVTQRRRADGLEEPDTRADSLIGYKRVEPNDLVINIMLAWNGSMGVSPYSGIASPAYCVYRFGRDVYPWYFHNLLRSPAYKARIKASSTGVVESRLRLYSDDLGRIEAMLPPPDEQTAIVRFLDWANGRLERAIQAKRKVIALLNEQKQAIIHRAVTRGLDPAVPLKPSGIPWLGDIPQHWEVRRLKSLGTKFGSGVTPRGGASVYEDSGVPLLRSQNVHFGELRLDKVARISSRIHTAMSGTHVQPKDVLLNITGASIGRVCAVPEYLQEANVNQHVCIIRPISSRCDAEYLAMFLATEAAQTAIYIAQNGSSREGLAVFKLKALPIVLPPLSEQRIIGASIQRETQGIRAAISRLECEIDLLREYRIRLVADVVTGKLDVREAAARLPDEAPPDIVEDNTDLSADSEDAGEEAAV